MAGGRGTRISEETDNKPKPMIEVGGWPLLWHIMKNYAHFGFDEFAVALGYRGEVIKKFFLDYPLMAADLTVSLSKSDVSRNGKHGAEDWTVHLVDTGTDTLTGSRVKRLASLLGNETFMVTYGDGVANVNIDDLLAYHRSHGLLATVTAVHPPARYGGIVFNGSQVVKFSEKPQASEGWINGGFLVFEPGILDLLRDKDDSLEANLMERLAADGQLAAYRHHGFWQCCDTLRELRLLQSLWDGGRAPWKLWS